MIIYMATNKINGKKYVGQTIKTLTERIIRHKNQNQRKYIFQRAIKKYGVENFEWDVLERCESHKELDVREVYWIQYFNTLKPNGYNIILGNRNIQRGENNPNYGKNVYHKNNVEKFFNEAEAEVLKGWIKGRSPKHIKYGIDNPNYNNTWTEKQKIIASEKQKKTHSHLKGKNNPSKRSDVKQKISKNNKGMNNGQAKIFLLTDPTGMQYIIKAGIKRKLKKFGLTYMKLRPVLLNKKENYNGWKLQIIGDKNECTYEKYKSAIEVLDE